MEQKLRLRKNGSLEPLGGLCNERLNYCNQFNFDVLGLSELHNVQNKSQWQGKYWITSKDAKIDEQWKSTDSVSGVVILLSKRFESRFMAQGSVGSRIVWVRIEGPVCPLFIVCVYVSHKYRKTKPFAEDVIIQLHQLLSNCKKLKPMDCVIVLGDLNCELQRNVQGCLY